MAKKMRALRLNERTWSQLEELAEYLQVGDRTKTIEVLAEQKFGEIKQDVLSAGYQANLDGISRDDCPYPRTMACNSWWLRGWNLAAQDIN